MNSIDDIWHSSNSKLWLDALSRYEDFLTPEQLALDARLDPLNLAELGKMQPKDWYKFLRDDYFVWKYTAPNRYKTTTTQLKRHIDDGSLADLDFTRRALLKLDTSNIRVGLTIATRIHGLGTAGASGLLALMYPAAFGTVDDFVVRALHSVTGLTQAPQIAQIHAKLTKVSQSGKSTPGSLTISDGVLLISLMREKASELNQILQSLAWSPRMLDKVLWAYGHD